MSSIITQADLKKGLVPLDAELFATSKGEVSKSGMHIPDLDLIDGKNIMPTIGGYTSFFGMASKIGAATGPDKIQKPITYRTYSGNTVIIAFARDGLYLKSLAGDDTGAATVVETATEVTINLENYLYLGWTKVFSTSPTGVWENWTWAILKNKIYLYQKGMNVILRLDGDIYGKIILTKLNPTYIIGTGKASTITFHVQDNSAVPENTVNYKQMEFLLDGVTSLGTFKLEVGNNVRKVKAAPKAWEEKLALSQLFNVETRILSFSESGFYASADIGGKVFPYAPGSDGYAVFWTGPNTNIVVNAEANLHSVLSNYLHYPEYDTYGKGAYQDNGNYYNIYDVELTFDYNSLIASGGTTLSITVENDTQQESIFISAGQSYEEVSNVIVDALTSFTNIYLVVQSCAETGLYKFVIKAKVDPIYNHVLTATSTIDDMPFISITGATAAPYLSTESLTISPYTSFSYSRFAYIVQPDNTHPHYNDVLPTGTILTLSTTIPNNTVTISSIAGETKGDAYLRLLTAYNDVEAAKGIPARRSFFTASSGRGAPMYASTSGPLMILSEENNVIKITPIDDYPVAVISHGINYNSLLPVSELSVQSRPVDINNEINIESGFLSPIVIQGSSDLNETQITIKKDGEEFLTLDVTSDTLFGQAFESILATMSPSGATTSDEGYADTTYEITITYNHIDRNKTLSAVLTKDTSFTFTQDPVIETALDLPDVEGIFSARNRLGAWTRFNKIHTSSASDPVDFTPSKTTQANEVSVSSIRGNIVHVQGSDNGFVIYSTGNIVIGKYTGEQFVYKYEAIKDSSGVIDPRHITGDLSKHFYWSNLGLFQVNPAEGSVQQLAPELTDWVNQYKFPILLSLISNRFLQISLQYAPDTFSYRNQREKTAPSLIDYGAIQQPYNPDAVASIPLLLFGRELYPTFKRTLIFDVLLGKWGTCDVDHKMIYSLNPINQQGFPVEKDYFLLNARLHNELRGLAIVDENNYHWLANDHPTDSYCLFGKWRTHRRKDSKLVEIFSEFVNKPTDTVIQIERTLDGKTIYDITQKDNGAIEVENEQETNLAGQWFNILVRGVNFHIKRLMARGYPYGR